MRAAFETEIILLNLSVKDMNKLNIDQSFGNRLEVATRQGKDGYNKGRITSKILKMNKNNQYGQEMTKSLPPGCIKEKKKAPS